MNMDDMIYRDDSIAEENLDPHGTPASDYFEEWSEEMSERTDLGYHYRQPASDEERRKRLEEMEEVVKKETE